MRRSLARDLADSLRPLFKDPGFRKKGNLYHREVGGLYDEVLFHQSRFDPSPEGVCFQISVYRSPLDPAVLFESAENWLAGAGREAMLGALMDAAVALADDRAALVGVVDTWFRPLVVRGIDLVDTLRTKEGREELRRGSHGHGFDLGDEAQF